jgi:hypothetical protein
MCDAQNDMVSVRAFMMAVNALHNVEWGHEQKTKTTAKLLIKQDEIITGVDSRGNRGVLVGSWASIDFGYLEQAFKFLFIQRRTKS